MARGKSERSAAGCSDGGKGAGLRVRDARPADREWAVGVLRERWGSTTIISRGCALDAAGLPALIAERVAPRDGPGELPAPREPVGLATYALDRDACQLVTLDALRPRTGIGARLLEALARAAAARGCARLWLITTNDNLDALRFYQRRGLRVVAVHRGAVDRARRLKPSIPLVGAYGIEIHDELELELALS